MKAQTQRGNLWWILALTFLLSLAFTLVARADDERDDRDYTQESRYGVARISLIHGDVTMMRGDTQDWVAANVNTPLVRGDRVYSGDRSRTEIQIDYANVLRLAERTEVTLADIARTRIQVQISRGLATYNVLRGSEADVELDTPNVAVRPLKEGIYRIEVTDSGNTIVAVRKGEAEVSTPQGSVVVKKGRQINVVGTDSPQYQVVEAAHKDDWDRFNERRNDDIYDARSYRYTSRYVYGVDDLDRYGRWVYVPAYGYCWYPVATYGWVPYRYGQWSWVPYYGWTWVSYEPWGWAPYHYGRWFYNDPYGWVWYPGPRHFRPYWAPAYVAFFGFGGRGWSVGFGFGHSHIGWLPCGPGDYFRPWWGRRHVTNIVNVTNITNITNVTNVHNITNVNNIFVNRHVRDAITTSSMDDFARGRVPRDQRPVDVAELKKASLVEGTVPVVPTRDIVRANGRDLSASAVPPARFTKENFFTKQKPPAGPARFDDEVANLRERLAEQGLVSAPGRKGVQGQENAVEPQDKFRGKETPGGADVLRGRPGAAEPREPRLDRSENPNMRSAPIGGSRSVPKLMENEEQKPAPQAPQNVPQGGVRSTGPIVNTPVQRERESAPPATPAVGGAGDDRRSRVPESRPGFRGFGPAGSPQVGGDNPPARGVEASPGPRSTGSVLDGEKDKSKPGPESRGAGKGRQPQLEKSDTLRPAQSPKVNPQARPEDRRGEPQSAPRQPEAVRPGWQRFGGENPGRVTGEEQRVAPKPREEPAPRSFSPRERPAPERPQSRDQVEQPAPKPRDGFQRFEQQPRREPEGKQENLERRREESSPSRWDRGSPDAGSPGREARPFGEAQGRPEGSEGRRPSVPETPRRFENPPERPRNVEPSRRSEPPREVERRPLEIHKPITVERPSRQAPPRSERQAPPQRPAQERPRDHKPDQ